MLVLGHAQTQARPRGLCRTPDLGPAPAAHRGPVPAPAYQMDVAGAEGCGRRGGYPPTMGPPWPVWRAMSHRARPGTLKHACCKAGTQTPVCVNNVSAQAAVEPQERAPTREHRLPNAGMGAPQSWRAQHGSAADDGPGQAAARAGPFRAQKAKVGAAARANSPALMKTRRVVRRGCGRNCSWKALGWQSWPLPHRSDRRRCQDGGVGGSGAR